MWVHVVCFLACTRYETSVVKDKVYGGGVLSLEQWTLIIKSLQRLQFSEGNRNDNFLDRLQILI